ncbi:hypothetical protein E2P81_ATG10996 [Venturia nashicola]|nr:hypothetical protein E2P81_ATG10996 [Venturia nashicola]
MKAKEHPFLSLPTEIRQQILALSLPDSEILSSIELRATQSRDNIWQTNVWEVDWHCGALPSTLKNGTRLTQPAWMVRLGETQPGGIPSAVFDFHVQDILRGNMEKRENFSSMQTGNALTISVTGWIKLDMEGMVVAKARDSS